MRYARASWTMPLILMLGGCATTRVAGETATAANIDATALTRTSYEPPGPNCAMGGSKIEIGQDRNGNGTLDADEESGGVFACNGPNGALIEASPVAPGTRCLAGGLEVRSGTDANGNGKLDQGEYESNFSCNATANDAPVRAAAAKATQ